jgi:S-(hydroxymethyl)glutathione dehydrogenase/alcohol dehydrogenase
VFAIDPNEWKQQQALQFGATHAFGDPVKAKDVLIDLTRGQLADKVICTVGEMDNDVVKAAVDMTGKAGTIVITGVGYYEMVLPGGILIGYHRKMQGSLFGGANPLYDIPMILSLWHEGHIKLNELITRTYTLDEINEGYQDLMDGKNIRGVVVHQH